MDTSGIFAELQAKFGENAVYGYEPPKSPQLDDHFFVAPSKLVAIAKHLRDAASLQFDHLECLTGVDYPDSPVATPKPSEGAEKGTIHVVYHLRSYSFRHRAVIKVSLPRSNPKVPSLVSVWAAANWHERECYDLLGVVFEGHPDLRRLLMPEDWVGHPLRKDFREQESYHGISTSRPSPLDLLTIENSLKKTAAKPDHG